jgi:hypothetical protein
MLVAGEAPDDQRAAATHPAVAATKVRPRPREQRKRSWERTVLPHQPGSSCSSETGQGIMDGGARADRVRWGGEGRRWVAMRKKGGRSRRRCCGQRKGRRGAAGAVDSADQAAGCTPDRGRGAPKIDREPAGARRRRRTRRILRTTVSRVRCCVCSVTIDFLKKSKYKSLLRLNCVPQTQNGL